MDNCEMTGRTEKLAAESGRQTSGARGGGALAFRVADIRFGVFSEGDISLGLDPALRQFAWEPGDCDLRVDARWVGGIKAPARAAAFESGGLWSAFAEGPDQAFYFSTPLLGPEPYKALRIDHDFRRGQLVLRRGCFDVTQPLYPLEYPLDELLMIHRLARGEGVELHAMGLVDEEGRGHLFLGHSGAGKSTSARIWQRESRALILSDDRIILRAREGRIWMHGTPWHGDAGIASPESAPLYRAYLLEHGGTSELAAITKGRAAAEFLARCFVPHYSAEAMDFTLGFLARVSREIPCCVFRFLPDKSAVEAICRAND
jgi:hypothetical protein